MSTVDNSNIDGSVKSGVTLVTELALQIGNTDTELDLRPEAAQNETISGAWTFTPGATFGGNIVSSATVLGIRLNTSDAADNGEVQISAGGAWGITRGAGLRLYGNEAVSPGYALLTTGDVAGAELKLNARNATGYIVFFTNNLERARIDASGNWTISGTMDGRDIAADGTKLDGIQASAKANLSDLLDVDITGRTDTEILEWDTTTSKYIHVTKPTGGGSTNISITTNAAYVRVNSDTGSDGFIYEATSSIAGVMTPAMHDNLDALVAAAAADTSLNDGDFTVNGLCTRTAAGVYENRTIAQGNEITVTNGNGVSGNPTIAFNRNITSGTGAAAGGSSGDIHLRYV